jgi:hypothetical protein
LVSIFKNKKFPHVTDIVKFSNKKDFKLFEIGDINYKYKKYDIGSFIKQWYEFVLQNRQSYYLGTIDNTEDYITKYNIKGVVAYNTSQQLPNIICEYLKNKDIPTFEILHGITSVDYSFLPARPTYTLSMGKYDANKLNKYSESEKFFKIGTNKFSTNKRYNFKELNISYAAVRNEKRYGMNILDVNYFDYEIHDMLKSISKVFNKQNKFKLIIKYTPGHPEIQYIQHNNFAKELLNYDYDVIRKEKTLDIVFDSSFCIITYDSTVGLEAFAAQIPVIFFNAKTGYYKGLIKYDILFANNDKELEDKLKFLSIESNYKQIIQNQNNILENEFEFNIDIDSKIKDFINKRIK